MHNYLKLSLTLFYKSSISQVSNAFIYQSKLLQLYQKLTKKQLLKWLPKFFLVFYPYLVYTTVKVN